MVDLSLHLMDIIQNSIRAGANRVIASITADNKTDLLTIHVKDNGAGMSRDMAERVTDPFFTTRTTRRVGLGIPLLKDAAEAAGGSVNVRSEADAGTEITATFRIGDIDRKPLGDIAQTMAILAAAHTDTDFDLILSGNGERYLFSTEDVRKVLDGVPLSEPLVARYIEDTIRGQITIIFGGILDEIIS